MPYELAPLIVVARSSTTVVMGLSGSTDGVGSKCQPFRINNLESVGQIFPRWNRLQHWFELAEAFRTAA
jgi:hypothetical protein